MVYSSLELVTQSVDYRIVRKCQVDKLARRRAIRVRGNYMATALALCSTQEINMVLLTFALVGAVIKVDLRTNMVDCSSGVASSVASGVACPPHWLPAVLGAGILPQSPAAGEAEEPEEGEEWFGEEREAPHQAERRRAGGARRRESVTRACGGVRRGGRPRTRPVVFLLVRLGSG